MSATTRSLTTRLTTLMGAGAIVATGLVGMGAPAAHADQGAMIIPTTGVITGNTNGYCSSGGAHGGFDIAAPTGTTIKATADGKVTFAGWGVKTAYSNPGNQVKLSHANGWGSDYRHLSRIAVTNGQTVKKGQVIGYVGSTGNSTGPHLHLTITRNGADIKDASLVDDFKCGSTVTQGREISYSFPGLPKTGGTVTSTYPTIQKGATGPSVTQLQQLLNARGHSVTVDGSFGPQTDTAVRNFQKAAGGTVDGQVGPKTWGALEARAASGATLKLGSNGNDVKALQKALNATVGANLAVDGNFGPMTKNAVIQYQKSRGLAQDGLVGPQTWAALKGAR